MLNFLRKFLLVIKPFSGLLIKTKMQWKMLTVSLYVCLVLDALLGLKKLIKLIVLLYNQWIAAVDNYTVDTQRSALFSAAAVDTWFTRHEDMSVPRLTLSGNKQSVSLSVNCYIWFQSILHLISKPRFLGPTDYNQMKKCFEIKHIQKLTNKLTEWFPCFPLASAWKGLARWNQFKFNLAFQNSNHYHYYKNLDA